ncbi:MAG TPA: hypothetical protein VG713_02905 [Pirellulales bacterium]|nr:hypothetical protein [Pirellulales bacterium]
MFTGAQITAAFVDLGITHVVWLPDSTLGTWDAAIEQCPALSLVRVCREGEAWLIAAGLYLGGKQPIVVMQTTGMFESGDAMRNALFDLRLPLYAIIGHRSYLLPHSTDSARRFAEPVLAAWGIDTQLLASPDELDRFAQHYRACIQAGRPGVTLLAEGKG